MPYNNLRRQMCLARFALTKQQLQINAQHLMLNFVNQKIFTSAHLIASFIAVNGEQNPNLINNTAIMHNKMVLLPIVNNFTKRLQFGNLDQPMVLNKFNIAEPKITSKIPKWRFDVVLLPLTAFDDNGGRLGMGGGYYDKTFAFIKYAKVKPKLIGVAHEFQKTATITQHDLDVPLDGILTEQQFKLFN